MIAADEIRSLLQPLRELGNDLNRGAHPPNVAEQIWDACDAISRALLGAEPDPPEHTHESMGTRGDRHPDGAGVGDDGPGVYALAKVAAPNGSAPPLDLLAVLHLAQRWLADCVPVVDLDGPKPLPILADAIAQLKRTEGRDGSAPPETNILQSPFTCEHKFTLVAWNRHEQVGHHCVKCGAFRPLEFAKSVAQTEPKS